LQQLPPLDAREPEVAAAWDAKPKVATDARKAIVLIFIRKILKLIISSPNERVQPYLQNTCQFVIDQGIAWI
jgi:hypothetical protein